MNLTSEHPFWPLQSGLIANYPSLRDDQKCEVVVVGGGITGALLAHELSLRGLETVVLERRDIAHGSTSASVSLLQYEVDIHLSDLIRLIGKRHAQRAYTLCYQSIDLLEQTAAYSKFPSGFSRQTSLYAASQLADLPGLQGEYAARKECGFDVEYLDQAQVQSRFQLDAPAMLVSSQGAVCNSYLLTHGLFADAIQRGCRVFDRTQVTNVEFSPEHVIVTTDRGSKIQARQIVYATGYEAQDQLQENIVNFKSTYAIVTQPLENFGRWPERSIFWETARPYLYLRTTEDGRILAGGEDEPYVSAEKRDACLAEKSAKLLKRIQKMLPELDLEIEFSWAGLFGETRDGLAYIGPSPNQPRAFYALGFGGNGITFSQIAAKMIPDLMTGIPNQDAEIFAFQR